MTIATCFIRNTCLLFLATLLISVKLTRAADGAFIVTQYTDDDGLPQNSIKGIGQDNLGFIWLISEKGPVRYDGRGQFRTFDSLSSSLKSVRMTALYKNDHAGDLMGRGEYGETVLLKDGKATLQTGEDLISSLFPRYKENIYFNLSLPSPYSQYYNEYVFVPDGAGGGFMIAQDSISHMAENGVQSPALYFPTGDLWSFASYHGKLIYFDQALEYTEIGPDLQIKKRKILGDILQLPPLTPFKIFWNSASDQLFIYAGHNFYSLSQNDTEGLHSRLLLSGFDFDKHEIITAHYMQSQRQLLLGSSTKGLFVIKERVFKSLLNDIGYSNLYYNQTLLPNGWLLTNNGMAFDSTGQFRFIPLLHRDKYQHGQIVGPDGNVWTLEHDSILVLTPGLDRIVGVKPFPAFPRVALKDDSNHYWIGGGKGLLLKYDAGKDTFRQQASFPGSITYLEQKGDTELFVSTVDRLFVFNMTDRTWKEIPQFRNMHVRSIRNESNRRYWITTYQHGFYLYENGQITGFPLDKALHLTTSHCTIEDKNGFIWISTNKGLFKVKKQQLLEYKNDRNKQPFYFYYDKQWGFQTNEFNGGCMPCAVELPNGNFSFPSLDGLVQFNPLAAVGEFPSGNIILDDVILDGRSLPIKDRIEIPHHFSRLDVKLATPFYANPNNIEIEYLLYSPSKGKPGDWVPLDNLTNTLSINELSSGDHEVRIRMRNGIGPDDFYYVKFHLYVQPLFHETAWFTIPFWIGVGLIIWFVSHLRNQYILKQNQRLHQKVKERTDELKKQYEWQQRLSASIAHDIKAPLYYIVKTLQAIHTSSKREGFLPDEIQQVYQSVKHMYHYSNNLTKLAKLMPSKDVLPLIEVDLHEVVKQQIDIFQSMAESQGNKVYHEVPVGTVIYAHYDALSIIIHNLLDNAIKFTQNGKIHIQIEQKSIETLVHVRDTGMGLYPEQLMYYNQITNRPPSENTDGRHTGFGLPLVNDMAHLIQAEVNINSVFGKGTTVTLIFRRDRRC